MSIKTRAEAPSSRILCNIEFVTHRVGSIEMTHGGGDINMWPRTRADAPASRIYVILSSRRIEFVICKEHMKVLLLISICSWPRTYVNVLFLCIIIFVIYTNRRVVSV